MDTSAPWRAIEIAEPAEADPAPERSTPGSSRLLLGLAALLTVASVAVVVLVESRQGGTVQAVAGDNADATASGSVVVVEVAGAVARPGVYSLPAGSRIADAIQAAGGYSPDVDPRAVEESLNLAAKLEDAQLIRVSRRGDATATAPPGAVAGLLDLNTATPEQLDTLPGIGPVTAAKIVAAREKQPFGSVDDLAARKIVSASTLAKFRDRVTVG
jgi:competence protein ComEA